MRRAWRGRPLGVAALAAACGRDAPPALTVTVGAETTRVPAVTALAELVEQTSEGAELRVAVLDRPASCRDWALADPERSAVTVLALLPPGAALAPGRIAAGAPPPPGEPLRAAVALARVRLAGGRPIPAPGGALVLTEVDRERGRLRGSLAFESSGEGSAPATLSLIHI